MVDTKAGEYEAVLTFGSIDLSLKANLTHLKFISLTSSIPLPVEYNTFFLTCKFSGEVVPTITWYKDNKKVRLLFSCRDRG